MNSKIKATPRYTQQVSDREIQPPVKCFCCQDSGRVSNMYLCDLVEFPANGEIVQYVCQRENCENGQAFLRCYNLSDQERDAYYNAQLRNGKDAESLPRPMKSRDYQANFSTNLNEGCCDWLHARSFDDWKASILSPTVDRAPIIDQVLQSVSDRDKIYKQLEEAIAQVDVDITERIAKFIEYCRDRDSTDNAQRLYPTAKSLPTSDYKVLLVKIRNLST